MNQKLLRDMNKLVSFVEATDNSQDEEYIFIAKEIKHYLKLQAKEKK